MPDKMDIFKLPDFNPFFGFLHSLSHPLLHPVLSIAISCTQILYFAAKKQQFLQPYKLVTKPASLAQLLVVTAARRLYEEPRG